MQQPSFLQTRWTDRSQLYKSWSDNLYFIKFQTNETIDVNLNS